MKNEKVIKDIKGLNVLFFTLIHPITLTIFIATTVVMLKANTDKELWNAVSIGALISIPVIYFLDTLRKKRINHIKAIYSSDDSTVNNYENKKNRIASVIIIVVIIGVISNNIFKSNNIPEKQDSFRQIINSSISDYNLKKDEGNSFAMTNLRQDRKNQLRQLFGSSLTVNNWVGKITSIDNSGIINDENDDVAIHVIPLDVKATLETWNNSISDDGFNTLIKRNSSLATTLMSLKIGDKVTFSGYFIPKEDDFLYEMSITENGSMLEPEFLFKFTDLKKK